MLSGEAALAAIDAGVFDLIVLDYLMPGMDGMRVLGILRRDSRTATVPIIIHSSAVDPALREISRHKGATAVLAKGECDIGQTINQMLRAVQG